MRTGGAVRTMQGPYLCGNAIATLGETIVTASWRGQQQLQRWDLGSGRLVANLPVHTAGAGPLQLYAVLISESGLVVTGGSSDHPGIRVRPCKQLVAQLTWRHLCRISLALLFLCIAVPLVHAMVKPATAVLPQQHCNSNPCNLDSLFGFLFLIVMLLTYVGGQPPDLRDPCAPTNTMDVEMTIAYVTIGVCFPQQASLPRVLICSHLVVEGLAKTVDPMRVWLQVISLEGQTVAQMDTGSAVHDLALVPDEVGSSSQLAVCCESCLHVVPL